MKDFSIPKIIEDINQYGVNLFIGAGISKDPPSDLPLADEFRSYTFNKLCLLSQSKLKRLKFINELRDIPFEYYIQILNEEPGQVGFFECFLKILNSGKPNWNHNLIANMVKSNKVSRIVTTNFDRLLERVLEKEKIEFGVAFTENEFSKMELGVIASPLISKIHGSVEDPSSIRATLKTISQRYLLESRKKVLEHLFIESDKDILILGYSCSDEFDINPFLRTIQSKNEVFFLSHKTQKGFTIKPLDDPLLNFRGCKIEGNTREFLGLLSTKLDITIDKDNMNSHKLYRKSEKTSWQEDVDNWLESLSVGQKLYLLGRVLNEIGKFDEALSVYKMGLEHSDTYLFALIQRSISYIYQIKARFEEAEKIAREIVPIFQEFNDLIRTAETIKIIGWICKRRGEYQEAEELFQKSLNISRSIDYQFGISHSLSELGMLYKRKGELKKAEAYYKLCLEIRRDSGDLKGSAEIIHELGSINRMKNNTEKAEELFNESLEIKSKIGDQHGIAASLHELGNIYRSKNDFSLAIDYFRKSLQITRKIPDDAGVSWTLHDLASVYFVMREYDKAEKLYRKSLGIKKRLKDQRGIATSLTQLGLIRMHQ
ncbi:MAG: tetratricopeptide repeat protein, partial [Flavobacteriaceae bacterium]|nr:tetratricopeptide repeat protein [Flavobacteriaceae bacterium]